MASASTRRTDRHERHDSSGGATRPVAKRHVPFVAPFLMAFPALLTGWLMHAYLRGVDVVWNVGRFNLLDWHLAGSDAAWAVTLVLLTLTAVGLSLVAWHVSDSRKTVYRVALTASVGVAVLDFAFVVSIGPAHWWSFFEVVVWLIVAGVWVLPRLDVTRRDPRNGEGEETKPDPIEERLGLVGYSYKPKQFTLDGDVVRTDIEVTHAPGGTIEPVRKAVETFESLADASGLGAPPGMSTARPGAGASRSTVSIIHKDILIDGVAYERPALKTDGTRYTIDEIPLTLGRFMDLVKATETIRSTQGIMGVTGAGKGQYARVKIAAMSSRSWVAPILYFDKVKGKQTVAPIVNALGVIVLSNDSAPHAAGLKALQQMVEYRADLLGELGYDEWEPGITDHDGNPVPKVIAWMEEADELIKVAPGVMVFLASKARSTGVVPVWSMQRPDGKHMPTDLRSNVVNWSTFGVVPADDYSADFSLGSDVIAAGARPFWGDTKPGYYYRTERETPADRWPVVRRIANASRQELWEVTSEYGPGMMPLDPGTIAAARGWYEQAATEAETVKASMSATGLRATAVAARPVKGAGVKGERRSDSDREFFDDEDGDMIEDTYTEDRQEIAREVDAEMREFIDSGEVPENPDPGGSGDIETPIPPVRPEDDVSWEDEIGGKPPAKDRAAALVALFRTLVALSRDESLRHPGDPRVTLFQVDTILGRYPFRSRPWFSEQLAALAVGELEIPEEYGLTLTVDDDDPEGQYHLHSVASVTELHPRSVDAQ